MNKLFILQLIYVLSLFSSCDYSDPDNRIHPSVETINVISINQNELHLEGKITPNSSLNIIDHGFVWNLEKKVNEGYYDKVSLGPLSSVSFFSTSANYGFDPDFEYYIRAYAKTKNETVFGNIIRVMPLGGLSPKVDGYTPTLGVPGDTITFFGENLSANRAISNISVGSYFSLPIIGGGGSAIQVYLLDSGYPSYSFANYNWKAKEYFTIQNPTHNDYYPKSGTACDLITIEGTNFGNGADFNIIKIDEVTASIKNATKTKIQFYLPPIMPYNSAGDKFIRHTVGSRTLGLHFYYNFIPIPSISSIEHTRVSPGQILTINGSNIPFCSEETIIVFLRSNNTIVTLEKVSVSKTQIKVQIPQSCQKGQYSLLIKVLDKESTFNLEID